MVKSARTKSAADAATNVRGTTLYACFGVLKARGDGCNTCHGELCRPPQKEYLGIPNSSELA